MIGIQQDTVIGENLCLNETDLFVKVAERKITCKRIT